MSKSNINIQLIVEGCRRGNRNSQRILFEHFFGYGMNVCLCYAKNREEAEEILNNGFLKVFRFIDKYDSEYSFTTWLRRIMVNTAIDYHRANQKALRFLELKAAADVEESEIPMPKLSPDEDVLPVLQKLSPRYRMVFNLHVMEGYRHDEIAEMLGISSSASRSNLVRAKRQLKTIILKNSGKEKALTYKPKKEKEHG